MFVDLMDQLFDGVKVDLTVQRMDFPKRVLRENRSDPLKVYLKG